MKYLNPPARKIAVQIEPTESDPGRPIQITLVQTTNACMVWQLSIEEARQLYGDLAVTLLKSDGGMWKTLLQVYEFSKSDDAEWEPVRKSLVESLVNRGLIEDPERFK